MRESCRFWGLQCLSALSDEVPSEIKRILKFKRKMT